MNEDSYEQRMNKQLLKVAMEARDIAIDGSNIDDGDVLHQLDREDVSVLDAQVYETLLEIGKRFSEISSLSHRLERLTYRRMGKV